MTNRSQWMNALAPSPSEGITPRHMFYNGASVPSGIEFPLPVVQLV